MKEELALATAFLIVCGTAAHAKTVHPCMGDCAGVDALATIMICPHLTLSKQGQQDLASAPPSFDLLKVEIDHLRHLRSLCQPECLKNKDADCQFTQRN